MLMIASTMCCVNSGWTARSKSTARGGVGTLYVKSWKVVPCQIGFLQQLQFIAVERVGTDRRLRLADDVLKHQLDRRQIAGLGVEQEDTSDVFDVLCATLSSCQLPQAAAVLRAKGFPGPPGLPLANLPLGSRPELVEDCSREVVSVMGDSRKWDKEA